MPLFLGMNDRMRTVYYGVVIFPSNQPHVVNIRRKVIEK